MLEDMFEDIFLYIFMFWSFFIIIFRVYFIGPVVFFSKEKIFSWNKSRDYQTALKAALIWLHKYTDTVGLVTFLDFSCTRYVCMQKRFFAHRQACQNWKGGHSKTRKLISSQIFRCIWEFLTLITFFTHFYTSFTTKKIGVRF